MPPCPWRLIDRTQFSSVTPIDFPPDLAYAELVTFLYTQDCPSGYFLIASGNVLSPGNDQYHIGCGTKFLQ